MRQSLVRSQENWANKDCFPYDCGCDDPFPFLFNGTTASLTGLTFTGAVSHAIRNEGTLSLTDSTVSGNNGFFVGGIVNNGMLRMTGSNVSVNTGLLFAGGIFNPGMLTLTDSTVSGPPDWSVS